MVLTQEIIHFLCPNIQQDMYQNPLYFGAGIPLGFDVFDDVVHEELIVDGTENTVFQPFCHLQNVMDFFSGSGAQFIMEGTCQFIHGCGSSSQRNFFCQQVYDVFRYL